jgi:ABC-type lipoprotein export system ATPase subunit
VPSAGDARVDGFDLLKLSARERVHYRRRVVGFIWQQTARNLLPYLSARENVELPMALDGRSRRAVRQRATELLEQVGLADRLGHRPAQLSGGEQQRVAIARALVHEPLLILADEPTGNLDSDTGASVLKLLLDLTRDAGRTLIMVTHSLDVVPLADRVFQLNDGQLLEERSVALE